MSLWCWKSGLRSWSISMSDLEQQTGREPLLHVVLVRPRIPPNTGNVARLCAALGIRLHLVGKLGFELSDRHLRRAGLDYWEHVDLQVSPDAELFLGRLPPDRCHFYSKRATTPHIGAAYRSGDFLIFGSETLGLPEWVFENRAERLVRIPMRTDRVRSLNLSSAAAVGAYEALRQIGAFDHAPSGSDL